MRKLLVSPMKLWMATVTIQSLLVAILLGPLFAPISLTTALKLNGTTTTTTSATPSVNYAESHNGGSIDDAQTTIASFLQPDNSETTLTPQFSNQDELTTTQNNISPSQTVSSSSPLAKRHSSIAVGETLSQNGDSPRFITKASSSSAEHVDESNLKPQRNGTRVSITNAASVADDGEQSLSSAETTAEQYGEADNVVPSTTGRDSDSAEDEDASASTNNSLGNNDAESMSLDKDESSDTYFSVGDDIGDNNANEGDSSGGIRGETGGDTIFPPEEDQELDTDESVGATTYQSLLRPAPTTNPQTFSFSSQLANKLNRSGGGGVRTGSSRLGTRGLSAKSELNAITASTTTTKPTSTNNSDGNNTEATTSDNEQVKAAPGAQDNRNNAKIASNLNSNIDSDNNSSSFDLNGSSFSSRSNANLQQQPSIHPQQPQQPQQSTQLLQARPTASVITNHNSNTNHNNNLHNRIIKRKKLPFGRGNSTATGSPLSSIYGNSILTSTPSSSGLPSSLDGEIIGETTVAAPASSGLTSSSLTTSSSTARVSATTESNSLVNTSHDNDDSAGSNIRNVTNKNVALEAVNQPQSSPASTSGGGVTLVDGGTSGGSNSNATAPLSSSRAILGFGTSSSPSSNYGKVKRPKPIIIRDRDESVYVNNLSENSAPINNNNRGVDETATVSGAGEEESNKPVGSNALPTPPHKVRKVKLTSRRVLTPTSRPTGEFDISPTTPTFGLPSVSPAPSATFTAEVNDSRTNRLTAEAASGATDYRQHAIRPSIAHETYNESPLFSSRRVYKEEFGLTRNSYGDDVDHHDDDTDLQATTEYFSVENPTPYPIPMGVRSAPQLESADNEERTGRNPGKNSGNYDSRYRDYYSEISSRSVEPGLGSGVSGNLHIKSVDSHPDSSPVTVTVTHTVVQTTPQVMPSTVEIALSSPTFANPDNRNGEVGKAVEYGVDNGSVDKGTHPNLLPTPALPSSIFVNPTSTEPKFEIGQGPAVVSQSVENVQVSTSRYGATQIGIQSSHSGDDEHNDDDDSSYKGNDQDEHGKQGNAGEQKAAPVTPQPIQPTPVITSKSIKSVYFTQVEHPHFTSSSYEFTTSTMYSYSFPGHDDSGMHSYYPEMMNHDDHLHPRNSGELSVPASKGNHPPEPEHGHSPEANMNGTTVHDEDDTRTTISDSNSNVSLYANPSSTPSQFWDDMGNLTKSSSSQVPIAVDQESGAIPTPTIDVDIYSPVGTGSSSKPDYATTNAPVAAPKNITTTGRPTTTTGRTSNSGTTGQVPGSLEDNEISEEEQRKQQKSSTTTTTPTTTLKPKSGTQKSKDKIEEDNEVKNSSTEADVEPTSKESPLPGVKTPFGVGESFGIGSVHVPVLVQMVLDVAQPVFCSHLESFKRMIVTVYGTQKTTKVDPEQIVVYTKPGCDPRKSGEATVEPTPRGTVKPTAPTIKVTTTPKGTFPLTSPPSRDGDEPKKSRSGKDIGEAEFKNITRSSGSTDVNKNTSETLSSDKSLEGDSAHQNKSSSAQIRSRRSTKMGTAAASAKNTNISENIKSINNNFTSSSGIGGDSATDNLLSVYFYVNNKNGSYDQDLTSSFVRLWNDSSRLTNVSNGNNANGGSGEVVDGNGGSSTNPNNSNEMFIKRVKKVGMISASHLITTTDEPSDENSGIIIAITVASIIAVCLFVLGVGLLIMRHRQSQTKFAKRCTPVTLDDYSLDNISVYNSFRRKQRLRGSKRSYTNAAFDDHNAPSRPVNAQTITTALQDVAALENEFRVIPNVTATLDDIPSGAETKNRYANVIPMPDTRVLLTFLDDIPNSDYINANYVRGVNGEQKRYIITQGPLEDTIVDFWRMVWEQQIRVIFMLTDFAEGGIAKCAEYYPRSETIDCSQLHGDFQITLERRDISDNCITSYLVLKDMERNLRRDVVHFWYHSWPEKGVPASPKMTIDFLNRTKKFTKESTPILVHCSPGTGRSGTVVACDIGMKEYDTQNKLDVPRIVLKVRQDRAGAVQTKEQYIHIYDVLHSYVSRIGVAHLESI